MINRLGRQTELPKLLGTEAFNNGGVIFLLWDEGGGSPPADDPPFIAISPNAKNGYVSLADYDTSAFLKTVETVPGTASRCRATPTPRPRT